MQSQLPEWVAHSAHNGYLEEYLAGGWVGIFFLVVMLLAVGLRINKALRWDGDYGAFRLAVLFAFLIGNFSESNIACMTPIGFLVPARCHRPCWARLRHRDASRKLFRNRVAAIGDGTGKDFRSHLRFLNAKRNSSANYSDGKSRNLTLLPRGRLRQA